ncbi:hypothetical protein [Larkinella harenae]
MNHATALSFLPARHPGANKKTLVPKMGFTFSADSPLSMPCLSEESLSIQLAIHTGFSVFFNVTSA